MKRAMFTLAAVLILTCPATPQKLAADVLLLSRVRRHIKEQLQQLPDISCLETVHREHQPANGRMRPLDTVRLEVLSNGEKEFYASPGDRHFSERPPISYVGSGALGDGFFGLYLRTILVTGSVSYAWKGEEEIGGRRLARWDYRVPLMWSGQTIQLQVGSGTVSLHGSFWADPRTYDVIRLAVNAGDFPPSLPLTEAGWGIDYAPTGLGGSLVVLLPQAAEFRMVTFTGETSHHRLAFTQCRVFGAQSTIRFDAPDATDEPSRFAAAAVDDTLRPLPGGLEIAVKLSSRIAGDAAVGALIDGVVSDDVRMKGVIVIPAGAPVRGRIRRLERYTDPLPYFVVALEFTEVELQRIRYRFDADLTRIDRTPGVEQTLSIAGRVSQERLTFSDLPGVATFFFRSARLDLPQGLRTVWTTRRAVP